MELEAGEEERELLLRLQSTVEEDGDDDDLGSLDGTEGLDYGQNAEEGMEGMSAADVQTHNAAQTFLLAMQQSQAQTGNNITLHNPADIVKDLEQEHTLLKNLHRKISDQLHRLQIEEVVLKKQVEGFSSKQEQFQTSPEKELQMDVTIASSIAEDFSIKDEGEENEEDIMLDDEEASADMRQLLARELGSNYLQL